MRILLDTNLLVRAAITPEGLAREILRLVEASEHHVLVLSAWPPLLSFLPAFSKTPLAQLAFEL